MNMDRGSERSIKEVFSAARSKEFFDYSPQPGDTVIDLLSHAGVASVSELAFQQLLAKLAKGGWHLQVVGGGYQCLLIRLRVMEVEGQRKRTVDLEVKSESGSTPVDQLSAVLAMLRDHKVVEELRKLTFTDAEATHCADDGTITSAKVDLRSYEARLPSVPISHTRTLVLTATATPELATLKQVLAVKGVSTTREHVGNTLCHRFALAAQVPLAADVFAASCHHQGNDSAAATVSALLAELKPQLLILAGIAAAMSRKYMSLGDVVIAEQVYRYDSRRKETDDLTLWAPFGLQVDHKLLSHASDLASDGDFLKSVSDRVSTVLGIPANPRVFIGDVASGDAVVDSAVFRDRLVMQSNRKLLALEMESAGMLRACETATPSPRAMVVRGISDYAANKEASDDNPADHQRRAACSASAFALEFLDDFARVAHGAAASDPSTLQPAT